MLAESLEEYSAVVNVEYLKERFEEGDMEVTAEYWGRASEEEQLCVRQSFLMTVPYRFQSCSYPKYR